MPQQHKSVPLSLELAKIAATRKERQRLAAVRWMALIAARGLQECARDAVQAMRWGLSEEHALLSESISSYTSYQGAVRGAAVQWLRGASARMANERVVRCLEQWRTHQRWALLDAVGALRTRLQAEAKVRSELGLRALQTGTAGKAIKPT